MYFRYDFDQKIDLSKFRKQAIHYIKTQDSNEWSFYLPNFKLTVLSTGKIKHLMQLAIHEITRNENGEITIFNWVTPTKDMRFQDSTAFAKFYNMSIPISEYGSMSSNNPAESVEAVIDILKHLSKLNKLKAFL